jgi:hypothetical protein
MDPPSCSWHDQQPRLSVAAAAAAAAAGSSSGCSTVSVMFTARPTASLVCGNISSNNSRVLDTIMAQPHTQRPHQRQWQTSVNSPATTDKFVSCLPTSQRWLPEQRTGGLTSTTFDEHRPCYLTSRSTDHIRNCKPNSIMAGNIA